LAYSSAEPAVFGAVKDKKPPCRSCNINVEVTVRRHRKFAAVSTAEVVFKKTKFAIKYCRYETSSDASLSAENEAKI
jgi:hypothetical protein